MAGGAGRSRDELPAVALRMARSLFFEKRCGGVYYRCGNCGQDQPIETPFPALKVARLVKGAEDLQTFARGPVTKLDSAIGPLKVQGPAPTPLLLGAKLIALICPECCAPTQRQLEQTAPRSYVDTDDQANLLGDF